MFVYHIAVVPREARRGHLWPLELELLMVVNFHVGVGLEPGSSVTTTSALNH